MTEPFGGNYQQLLLKGAENGRLKAHLQRTDARPASGDRSRNGGTVPLRREPGPAPRPFRQVPSGAPPSRINNPQGSRSFFASQPAAVVPPAWSTQKSATVIIRGVPPKATPWDIRQFFEQFGKVVWVELDDVSRGGVRSAKVRFEPPPTDLSFFQQGECRLGIGGTVSRTRVEFPKQYPDEPMLTTPLGNSCPALLVLKPNKLTFGLLTQPTTFMRKKEVLGLSGEFELKFTADFRRKRLVIHFPLLVHCEQQCYRIDIKFSIIRSIHRITTGKERSALVISVVDPPLVRRKHMDPDGHAWADRLVWGEDELWQRAVEIKLQSQNPRAKAVSLDEEPNIIDLGRWTTYWIDLDQPAEEMWSAIQTHLHDWNIHTHLDASFAQVESKSAKLWELLDDPPAGASTETASPWNNDLALLSPTGKISLPFDVRYQLEVCISHEILCEYNIQRDFLEKLLELGPNRARLILEYAADKGETIYNPLELLKDPGALTYYPTTLHIPDYCALVRKVIVTPTRIYFNTPTVETTNRIVRRYKQVQDHFIRVQFTDELLEGRIRACEVDRDDELYTRVYRVMMQGIRMGRWHWKFLAFGNSQIRENGAFFFCQAEGYPDITCDTIRQWMGNFSHISTVAKLAARLGQCFSTTRLLRCISSPWIVKIPDVEKGGFCFTDGVGKISMVLASLVSQDWKIYPPPSAFQFRMGGCKGVLVTWPDAKGMEVHIRPSQEKFSAEYNGLEIIRCSQFSCATLNRQTILILSCLGVPDDVFTSMMDEQISNYDAAMTDKDKAVELLSSYVDENMTSTTIARMVLNGFMHTQEPFVRTLLQLWRSWSIKGLKEKARLIVDQGAFVLGCVDETGSLRGHSKATEGRKKIAQHHLPQIFLQVPDPRDRGAYKVITGLCLVGRNPSLHPGDIRVVEAVDLPQLRHLRDVVVFPLSGDRDIPSMCSGGDLDGDDFFVIWDPKLIPPEWSHPPMNYSAPKSLTEPRASTAKSLATFFVLFMKNDRLPLIAHAHLATADYEVEGAKHRKCLQLAELHSTAVDYVKTGVPAEWNKKLDPRKYPHFMEKPKSKSYHSTSVLGKLYDMVDRVVFDNSDNYKLPFDDRILSRFHPLGSNILKEARKIKTQYDIAMRRIMGQLEIRTEFEVWTAFVLSKPRVGTDYKVQEKVGREAAGLKKQFRDLCLKVAEEHHFDRLEFAAAMYRVTWEETRIALYEARQPHVLPDGTVGLRRISARSMPLISFPWLFPNELGRIAIGAERLSSLNDFVARPAASAKQPKLKGSCGISQPSDAEVDLAAMEYTRTSDGQFIHRGEILHLFRHDDEREEDFDCGDGVVGSGSPPDSDSEEASEKKFSEDLPTNGKHRNDFPVLVDAGTVLDCEDSTAASSSSTTSAAQEMTVNKQWALPLKTVVKGGDSPVPDLLSSDTDTQSEWSPCLTPDRIAAQQLDSQTETTNQQEKTTEEAQSTAGVGKDDAEPQEEAPFQRESGKKVITAHAQTSRYQALSALAPQAEATEFPPLEYIRLPTTFSSTYTSASSLNHKPALYKPWGRSPAVWGSSTLSQNPSQSLRHSHSHSHGDGDGGGDGGGQIQNRTGSSLTPAASGKEEESKDEAGTIESGEEAEYEEEVVEIETETALERAAARFA